MNNLINASNWTQGLHQAAHENQTNIQSSFSELHPISNLTESLAYPYHRIDMSATADLRSPSTTSGDVQLSGEHNSAALAQVHLEPSEPKQKLVSVPPEYRRENENEHTRISMQALRLRKRNRKGVPVPSEYRRDNEDAHTRISPNALALRKRHRASVPVPPKYRLLHEDGNTRIKANTLSKRRYGKQLVPIPQEYRRNNENEHTRISHNALALRKRNRVFVPVPPKFRHSNEDEHTQIRLDALYQRKRKKLKSEASFGEKPHVPLQAGEASTAITLADSNSARQNSPIHTRSPSDSNASALHETMPQDTMSNRINASSWNQSLHQAAHENQANITSSFSELHPISNLTESLAYHYHRVDTSVIADLRSPSTTSGEAQLSGEPINSATLTQSHLKQNLVPVPPRYRLLHEDENTRVKASTLSKRRYGKQLVPVPWKYRRDDENEHTRISHNALALRKHKKLKSAALSGEKPHASHQVGETSAVNTLADSNSARQNSPIHTRLPSGSNASGLHETALQDTIPQDTIPQDTIPQDTMETYESLFPFESETAFSHWLDDMDAQQSAIDYILNCQWQNGIP